ncbi:uncharacterized protein LOC126687652 [Mercurialis annua]|uniref:uncharacterized protein LOC126687652 n=1 Tax=Mercurialis annua TaxID=3986 RepID=UPI00215E9CB8|nr:uncharacterized protein LOC126687652 [Mercurialis annua]
MQIEDLSHEIAYTALLNGTTNSDLRKELLSKSQRSFTALMTIAHTQIRADDCQREIANRHRGRTEEGSSSERRNKDRANERSPNGKRFGDKGNDRFRDNGHTTNECWHLKEEIEKLIERGSLAQFIKRDTETKEAEVDRKRERREEASRRPRPELAGVINVIMSGPMGGDSNTTRKKAARTVYSVSPGAPDIRRFRSISFSEVDGHGLSLPHEDALVVKGRLNNFEVSRMLVDTGSSVNMITMEVFNIVGLKKENLTQVSTPLVGLGGKSVHVEGSLEIDVQLGDRKYL